MAFAATYAPIKPTHRVRKVILWILGIIVLVFVALVIIGLIVDSNEKSSRLKPANAPALLASGDQFFAKGDYDHAIADYRDAVKADDTLADAHSHLCNAIAVKGENAQGQKGDYAAAVSECERAVQLTPTSAEAHNNLCNALIDKETYSMELKGNYDRAIGECREALKLRPVYAEAYNNLCNAIGTRAEQPIAQPNDRSQAMAACRKAIELKPAYADAHKNLADLFRDDGNDALDRSNRGVAYQNFQKAAAEYRRAVAVSPRYRNAQSSLGYVLYQSSDASTLAELNKAIEIDPTDYSAYLWRGNTYLTFSKDYGQAIADFQKVMELKPDLSNGEYGMWLAYRAQGNLIEARQHLTRAHALSPDDKTVTADYNSNIIQTIGR